MRDVEEYKVTANNGVWKKLHKWIHARCAFCKWHQNENANSHPKFGKKKGHPNTQKVDKNDHSLG